MTKCIDAPATTLAMLAGVLVSLGACRVSHPSRADTGRAATGTPAPGGVAQDTSDRVTGVAYATGADHDSAASVNAAVAVVRHYYAAINAKDYASAYADWSEDGPPGHLPLIAFKLGFSKTDSVALSVGAPGPIGAAAGSRYVEIPVSVSATQHDGEIERYQGTYMLRRAVVDGASAAQRRWHLYRAQLTRQK